MTLSNAQIRLVQDWLHDYVKRGCPSCGCESFSLDHKLQALIAYPENSSQLVMDESMAVLTLRCRICANLRFFSAASILTGTPAGDELHGRREPSLADKQEAVSI